VDLTQTMETLSASADTANQAAETALLASEGVVALSTHVSDEVRSAVQQAIKAAAPPPPEEEEAESPLKQFAPVIVGALTLCGVGYLSIQNSTLSEQVAEQQQQVTSLEEQLQVSIGESGSQIMLLAEQGQQTQEAIQALAVPAKPTEQVTEDDSKQIAILEGLGQKLVSLQAAVESLQIESLQAATASAAAPAISTTEESVIPATVAVVAPSSLTLDAVQDILKQEITPLHQTLKSVESQIVQQALSKAAEVTTQKLKKKKRTQKSPKLYRFP